MRRIVLATTVCATVGVLCWFTFLPSAQSQKKDPEPRWIVDDVNAGFAMAKKTGKPLMIVFR